MTKLTRKELSLRDLLLAKDCVHSALVSEEMRQRAAALRREDSRSHKRLVKDVVRRLLSDDTRKAEVKAQREVAQLSLSEQKAIIRKARKIAEARIEESDEEADAEMNVQNRWYDSESGWTILFKPNRVETLTDAEGDFVRVTGWTGGKKVTFRMKEMARLFGLMQFIQEKGEMRVQMVFESLVNGEILWSEMLDSPESALERLKEMQGVLEKVEEARLSDRVPQRSAGKHCLSCPVHLACKQGARYLRQNGLIAPEPVAKDLSIAGVAFIARSPSPSNSKSFKNAA